MGCCKGGLFQGDDKHFERFNTAARDMHLESNRTVMGISIHAEWLVHHRGFYLGMMPSWSGVFQHDLLTCNTASERAITHQPYFTPENDTVFLSLKVRTEREKLRAVLSFLTIMSLVKTPAPMLNFAAGRAIVVEEPLDL